MGSVVVERFIGGKIFTRPDARGEFDELFADSPHVHMEMMDDRTLWIGLTYKDQLTEVHVTVRALGAHGKLEVIVNHAYPV